MAKIDLSWSGLTTLSAANLNLIGNGISGVYRLSYKHPDNKIYVFFVGESHDLKSKLNEHISNETSVCIKNHIDLDECFFKYAAVQTELRVSVARQLIKFYQPSCNERIPDGDDGITINIS